MSWFRALLLSVSCLLLVVGSSFAAPLPQTWPCEIGSLPSIGSFLSERDVKEEPFELNGHQLTLRVCAPESDNLTGDNALDKLKVVLPHLSELAGVPLNGGYMRPLVILAEGESATGTNEWFYDPNAIYVPATSPERMIIHGGAHYWADNHNFAEPWMIEGYAEYLTERVTDLKRPYVNIEPCDNVPLMHWTNVQHHTIVCEYVVSAEVFNDLAAAIGPDTLRNILSEARRNYGPITSWQLMVSAERASSSSLSHLFRGRVFPASMNEVLDQRDALHSRIAQAELQLSEQHLPALPVLRDSFNDGDFATTEQWLDALVPVLESTGSIMGSCSRLKLTCESYWQPLPDSIAGLKSLQSELDTSHLLLGQYSALRTLAQNSGIEPTQLHQQIGTLDARLLTAVQDSADMLRFGQAIALRCQGLEIECTQWQQPWAQNQLAASRQQIDHLKEMLDRVPELERTCAAKGWPCEKSWLNTFKRTNSPTQTLTLMEQIDDNLDELSALTTRIAEGQNSRIPLLDANVSDTLDEAHHAFADGDIEGALMLAREARQMQERGYWLPSGLLAITVVLAVLAIGWVFIRRRRNTPNKPGPTPPSNPPTSQQPLSDQQFLEQLLK